MQVRKDETGSRNPDQPIPRVVHDAEIVGLVVHRLGVLIVPHPAEPPLRLLLRGSTPLLCVWSLDTPVTEATAVTDFMHERIKPSILAQWCANNNDWSMNPRVEYELRDYLILTWGMNTFWGPSDSLFGYYKNRNAMYLEVKLGF